MLAALMAGSALQPAWGQQSEPTPGGTLIVARHQAVTSFDIAQVTGASAYTADKIFETLFVVGQDGSVVPWLATDAQVSDDGLVWTISLRDGVVFSDGSPLTASDVVFSLERHIALGTGIKLLAPITGIAAPDDATVVISLSEPYAPLLADLSAFSNGILPKDLGGLSDEEFFRNPVGTGPFVLSAWDVGASVTLSRNERYWQDGKPYLDTVVVTHVEDTNQLIQQLQGNQVNYIDVVAPARYQELVNDPNVTVQLQEGWSLQLLEFNTLDQHFSDVHVRRAVQHAIDREAIAAATSFGTALPGKSILPPAVNFHDAEVPTIGYDLDKAKAELAQSSHPDGFSTTLLLASGDQVRGQQAQIIQSQLAAIGIDVTISSLDAAVVREQTRGLNYAFRLASGLSDVADPNIFLSYHLDPDGGSNSHWTSYSNEEFSGLLRSARAALDTEERAKLYSRAQAIIAEEGPIFPIAYPSNIKAWAKSVHGIEILPNGAIRLENAWIEPSR